MNSKLETYRIVLISTNEIAGCGYTKEMIDYLKIVKKLDLQKFRIEIESEFTIGQYVTLERYGRIDIAIVVGYGEMPISKNITYKLKLKGHITESGNLCVLERNTNLIISTSGIGIVESKFYESIN